jgi:outer membrane biosynthesis protein TonB
LDQAAIACVLKWQYTPTQINGEPKPVRMTATIAFGTLIPPLSSRPVP